MIKYSGYFNGEPVKVYEIDEPVIFIGRLPENNIPISNMGVSRRHVKIELDLYNSYTLTDLNSLNGTLVNGKKVKKVTLCHGDKITIGKYTIVYEDCRADSVVEQETIVAEFRPEEMQKMAAAIEAKKAAGSIPDTAAPRHTSPPPVPTPPPISAPDVIPVSMHSTPVTTAIPVTASIPAISPPPIPAASAAIAGANANDAAQTGAVLIETSGHVVYKLDRTLMTIGSDESDDIYATGFGVNKAFATVEQRDGGFYISAQKVMSKIKINGKNVRTHRLEHRDRIEIGSNTFRFMENG